VPRALMLLPAGGWAGRPAAGHRRIGAAHRGRERHGPFNGGATCVGMSIGEAAARPALELAGAALLAAGWFEPLCTCLKMNTAAITATRPRPR